ncbi:GerAB/ArcD/ProY family transporter [Cohnella massiliensis]|uniref:GerAB/ArcD/ProY family transporter n=1 Tax=Cohnella massiliensis TaxID=1816691 RepID=UPI0009BBFE03|nr:endospore germination permease [Cohnella massiliensis]
MERISQSQLLMFMVLSNYGANAGFVISALTQTSGYAGWLGLILGWAISLLGLAGSLKIASYRPDAFVTHFGKSLIGKWLHPIVMLLLFYYMMNVGASILRELGDFLIHSYFINTPEWAILTLFGAVCALAARTGIESIFRCAEGFLFFIVIGLVLVPFMLSKEYIWPIAGALIRDWDLRQLVQGTVGTPSYFQDSLFVMFLYPYLRDKKKTFRTMAAASAISLVMVLTVLIPCYLTFGKHLTAQLTYPSLELIRTVRLGDFLENIDPFVIALWMASLFLKNSLLLFLSMSGFGQLLGLKNAKPLAFSFGAIMIAMSKHVGPSLIVVHAFIEVWPAFTYFFAMLLIFYLVPIWLKKKNAA